MSRSIGLLPLVRVLPQRFHLRLMPTLSLSGLVVVALIACGSDRTVSVRVSIPDVESIETPAAGVGVIALPYDRDSILSILEARAGTPRPNTAALDTLFARFRGPFTRYTRVSYAATQLRDSISVIRKQLDAAPPGSPEHRALRSRLRQTSDSFDQTERRAERARQELDRARHEFVRRSDTLRARVRLWEDSTYRGWDSIVQNLTRGRAAVTDTTGDTGWARLTLRPGRWWLYARAWDTSDPNAEWYWNVPVDEDTVLLSSRTGERRPRY